MSGPLCVSFFFLLLLRSRRCLPKSTFYNGVILYCYILRISVFSSPLVVFPPTLSYCFRNEIYNSLILLLLHLISVSDANVCVCPGGWVCVLVFFGWCFTSKWFYVCANDNLFSLFSSTHTFWKKRTLRSRPMLCSIVILFALIASFFTSMNLADFKCSSSTEIETKRKWKFVVCDNNLEQGLIFSDELWTSIPVISFACERIEIPSGREAISDDFDTLFTQ